MLQNQIFDFSSSKKEIKEKKREEKNPAIRFMVHIQDADLL
jgi:hypothetical protein